MSDILDSQIQYLPGIGPKRAELLGKELNIFTFRDLLYFFPFRHIDRSRIYNIREVEPSMAYIQVRGKIIHIGLAGETPKNKRLIATLKDSTGSMELIFFKGIKWIEQKLKGLSQFIPPFLIIHLLRCSESVI